MANEYVTSAALKATLTLTGQTYADADIAAALTAASRALDGACYRRFWKDADALQVRNYTPVSKYILGVDDIIAVTSLKTDPSGSGTFTLTWTLNSDYTREPLNAAADNWPWTLFRVHPRGLYQFTTAYPRTVEVTGQFGWPAVPAEITEATTILASTLLKRAREAPFGVVALGIDTAARITKHDPHIQMLIAPYVKQSKGLLY